LKVVVSTIHKAKGLEFDGVVVTSCVKDVFPHYYSKSVESVREDARLLYVGLTRAKKEIVITTHDTTVNRGGSFPRYPSPFLQFLPQVSKIDHFAFD
jgi:DNA helicase-2/ATP-dependent DNA helicase PcrA